MLLGTMAMVFSQNQLDKSIENLELNQKNFTHTPQTKVLEFLVEILSGMKHMQEVSRSALILDLDTAVAKAQILIKIKAQTQ